MLVTHRKKKIISFQSELSDCLEALCSFWLVSQGVKPASYSKVSDPEIKEIIGECICHRWEERYVGFDVASPLVTRAVM